MTSQNRPTNAVATSSVGRSGIRAIALGAGGARPVYQVSGSVANGPDPGVSVASSPWTRYREQGGGRDWNTPSVAPRARPHGSRGCAACPGDRRRRAHAAGPPRSAATRRRHARNEIQHLAQGRRPRLQPLQPARLPDGRPAGGVRRPDRAVPRGRSNSESTSPARHCSACWHSTASGSTTRG